jgi:fatty acid desaturase
MPRSPAPAGQALDVRTAGLLSAMYALWVGNFALYWTAPLPLAVHVALATLAIHFSFTVWHEGVHRNASRVGWLNDVVGILGIFPYMTPYFLQKWVHLQHHSRLNERDDPNRIYVDGPFWSIGFRYPRIVLFLRERVGRDPRSRSQRLLDLAPLLLVLALAAGAWSRGVLLDLALLWFLPVVLAKVVMDWYVNYLPHVGLPASRYGGTRIVDLPWLTPFVLAHNYHAIHHLWPGIPWHRYPSVFRERLATLREHGVPIEKRLTGFTPRPAGGAG